MCCAKFHMHISSEQAQNKVLFSILLCSRESTFISHIRDHSSIVLCCLDLHSAINLNKCIEFLIQQLIDSQLYRNFLGWNTRMERTRTREVVLALANHGRGVTKPLYINTYKFSLWEFKGTLSQTLGQKYFSM